MNNLTLITGDDALAIKNNAVKLAFSEKEKLNDEFSFEVIGGDDEATSPQKILENLTISIHTPNFFGDTKTVWLKHFSHFNMLTGKTKSNKDFQELFKSITEVLSDGLLEDGTLKLIIDGPELDKRTAFYKFCNKHGKVLEFNKIKSTDKDFQVNLRFKIKELCEEENVKINGDAVEFLSETVGSDTGRLTSEISKLCSYISGVTDTITVQHCHEICTKSIEMANWIFAESLADKNLKQSIFSLNILIENLLSEGKSSNNPELTMFFSAVRKFQEILKVKKAAAELSLSGTKNYNSLKSELEQKTNSNQENFLFKMHPYRAFMLYKQAENFTESKIVEIFTELLKANKELVSGNSTPRIVLENLIFKVCTN